MSWIFWILAILTLNYLAYLFLCYLDGGKHYFTFNLL